MNAYEGILFVTEVATLFPPQGEWTEQAYFALPETNRFVELSDGVLTVRSPHSPEHQGVLGNLLMAVREYVDEHDLGTAVLGPFCVRLRQGCIRQPEIAYYKPGHEAAIGQPISGPPDWVAETISPGTRSADEVDKLAEYAEAGIAEYWMVDPEAKTIRVYALRGGSAYTLAATYAAGQVARSETLPGFEAAVDRIV